MGEEIRNSNETIESIVSDNMIDDEQIESPFAANEDENMVQDDGYDFEAEEKAKEKTFMQKVVEKKSVEFEDDVDIPAVLKEVESSYTSDSKMGFLHLKYLGKNQSGKTKEISDTYFFDETNLANYNFNLSRLENTMLQYNYSLTFEDYESTKSLEKAIKHLIGSKVFLIQKTKKGYKNYTISRVVGK